MGAFAKRKNLRNKFRRTYETAKKADAYAAMLTREYRLHMQRYL